MKKLFSLMSVLCVAGLGVGLLAACDDEEEEHTHSYTSSVTTAATCTEDGVMTYTCSCGDTYTEVIKASGHTVGEWVVTLEPTCTEAGTQVKSCSVCGEVVETEDIKALGHDFSSVEYLVTTVVAEYLDDGEDNTGSTGGWYYVCSRCGEVGEALAEDADPLEGGAFSASTAAGLEAALDAVNEATGGEEVVITLTGDIEADGLEISGSNVTLTGEGELTLTDSIEVSGSDVTLDGLTIDATGVSSEKEQCAAVKVTGASTVITGCTIVGGGTKEDGTVDGDASILIVPAAEESEVTISECDISGAYHGVFVDHGQSVNLTVSDSVISAPYAFNLYGKNTNTDLAFTSCGLYGWTSIATIGTGVFTDCTFGFVESEATTKVTGGFRPYSSVTLIGCHFCSLDSSGITLVGDQTNDTIGYLAIESNNYGISVGNDNVVITLISCTYDQSGEDGSWTPEDLSEVNVINIMCNKSSNSCDFSVKSGSGFVFPLGENPTTVWTLTALNNAGHGVPTTSGDTGNDEP